MTKYLDETRTIKPMPSNQKQIAKQWITLKVSEAEMNALETYGKQYRRTKTDLLREMIRSLPTYSKPTLNLDSMSLVEKTLKKN